VLGGVPAGAVRPEGKLIESNENGRLEQYNFKDDLGERTNLARRLPRKAAELHALLKRWRASVKAVMPSPNPGYDAAKVDQGVAGAEPPTAPL
jgi:hypothetical protein